MKIILVILLILFGYSSYAYAYIGPGIGLGALISVVGVLLAIIFLLIALVWFPLKDILGKKSIKKQIIIKMTNFIIAIFLSILFVYGLIKTSLNNILKDIGNEVLQCFQLLLDKSSSDLQKEKNLRERSKKILIKVLEFFLN